MCLGFFSLWKFGNSSAVYKPKINTQVSTHETLFSTGPRVSDFSSLVFRNTNVRGIFTRQHDGAEMKMAEVALVKK